MKYVVRHASALLAGLVLIGCSDTQTAPRGPQSPSYVLGAVGNRSAFTVRGTIVNANGEAVSLTGGGSFDPLTASNVAGAETSGHGNGGFGCVTNIASGKLAGCQQGEGVRWDTEQLLQSSPFKCGGVANEQGKTAVTGEGVVVLQADFYRAGDGVNESFKANMFIADHDLADDVPGIQNVWIQTFGCGTLDVHFVN